MARILICLAVSLAALIAPTLARNYQWVGGTTNFSDPLNWANGFVPNDDTAIPCSTTFGIPNANIYSQLDASVYYVGQALYLPLNGVIRLAISNTVISFTDFGAGGCPNPGVTAQWTAGSKQEMRNNFYCHMNWIDQSTGQPSPTDSPPCDTDTAYFDPAATYDIFLPTNVSMVVMQNIQLGDLTVSTVGALGSLLPQIDLVDNPATTLYLSAQSGFNTVCKPLLQYQSLGQCTCFSSCPTPTDLITDQNIITGNQQAAANALAQQQNANVTKSFSGTYSWTALSVSKTQLANNMLNATQRAALQAAAQAALVNVPSYAATITTFQISTDNTTITVAGSITAKTLALFPPGGSAIPSPFTWAATAVINPNATRVQALIQAAIAPLLLSYTVSQLQAQIASLPPAVQSAVTTLASVNTTVAPPAVVLSAANSDPCFSTCTSVASCQACVSSVNASLVQQGIDPVTASQLAAALTNAKGSLLASGGDWNATSSQLSTAVSQQQQANNAVQQQQQTTPQLYSVTSPPFYIGRSRQLAEQLRALTHGNIEALLVLFKNALLQGIPTFVSVDSVQLGWTANVPSNSRRRALPTTASANIVTFTYTLYCLPSDATCRATMQASNPLYTSVTTQLNNAFNSYTFAAPQCQVATGPSSFTFNSTCLQIAATTYCANLVVSGTDPTTARGVTAQYIYNLTYCGNLPAYPDGSCYDTTYTSIASANASSYAAAAQCVPPTVVVTTATTAAPTTVAAAASSSGGGGGGLGLAAGAAGGGVAIVLIIIIVIVVMRRRRAKTGPRSGKRVDDRTVVAFENPMYDDPGAAPGSAPTYDSGVHDSEGLYDEPAFSGARKSNPVYQSHEDLTTDTLGGTAQGGDGYLDVQPKTGAAEDVGYLDHGEQAAAAAPARANASSEENPVYNNADDHEPQYNVASNIADPVYAEGDNTNNPIYGSADLAEAE